MVVLGSATSWMLDNVIDDYGGLHGRLTETIKLRPFTLAECERYYKKHGLLRPFGSKRPEIFYLCTHGTSVG